MLFDPVNASNVGVIELRECLGLAFEACQAIGILGQMHRQRLNCNFTIQPRVTAEIDHTHSSATDLAGDFVGTERGAGW